MTSVPQHCFLHLVWLLWLGPVGAWGQGAPAGQPAPDSAGAMPRHLKMSPVSAVDQIVVAASVQQLISRAPANPLNRRQPPANPVVLLPAQTTTKLLRKIKTALVANGYTLDAYRPDSLACRISKASEGISKDKYLLWLEPAASPGGAIRVFAQYGNFMHVWGTPAGQESATMTSPAEYDKKIKLLKSVLDAMPR